ncbi:MAG TPA: hypothetical protein VMS02_01895 [Solirubrobacteraceae bacterium]|nr:hypothetical protein [Solirubrobacteraceae bacterium]
MRFPIDRRRVLLAGTLAAGVLACALSSAGAVAQAVETGGAEWRLEQPRPPAAPPGTPEASVPIGLGQVGDIEFWEPNRGLLITHGNGPAVPPGVWAYDGTEWREIAEVCGASEGSIAWAGPDEFWTVSDGRPGQTNESSGTQFETQIPLEDNTLCHFAGGSVVASYAHPAGQADSYQAMHAAACIPPPPPAVDSSDCWFGGDPLPEPQLGAFHLHWNGSALEAEPYLGEAHAVQSMSVLEGALYESVRIRTSDRVAQEKSRYPVLHTIEPGADPAIAPEAEEPPLYGSARELSSALEFLHLSAAEGALWGAAGKSPKAIEPPEEAGQVTVVRRVQGVWSQPIGPGSPTSGISPNPLGRVLVSEAEERKLLGGEAKAATVSGIAAEPGSENAWLALRPPTGSGEGLSAVLVHISPAGKVLGAQVLPSQSEVQEGIGPKGAAARISCPAVEDCWMATTAGWLYHLAPEGRRTLPANEISGFRNLVTFRPPDLGLPQVIADAPPPDTSGLNEEFNIPSEIKGGEAQSETNAKVQLPLLSHLHSRLLHGSTLQLSFHLAVKARVRLLAKRHGRLVAATAMRTLKAGSRTLQLRLNPHSWPTKLSLQTHALAPLPLVSSVTGEGANVTTVTTGFVALPHNGLTSEPDRLP